MPDLSQNSSGTGNKQAGRDLVENNLHINHINADALENLLTRRPTLVAKVITSLSGKIEVSDDQRLAGIDPYGIQEKIDFNNVKQYKEIFERYAEFGAVIDSVCDSLDVDAPDIKRKLFEYIKTQYLLEKGILLKRGLSFADHADDIVTAVRNHMLQLILNDSGTVGLSTEDIDLSLTALITKAFIDCKVLEHPGSKEMRRTI